MRQATCSRDIFFAPVEGEVICVGSKSSDILPGSVCSINCASAVPEPGEIECLPTGWSHESASCDATNGSLPPGAQIALIVVVLGLLCGGTFAWQKYKAKTKAAEEAAGPPRDKVKYAGQVTDFDVTRTYGMGRDGFDNLQTVGLGECTPLPQPKNRPSGGYHPAGAGIHDFMGTCTIGTVSQHPKLGPATIDQKHLA